MAKEKSVVQNPESAVETLTETSNDVITQNDVVGTEVDNTVDQIVTPEVIDQTTVTPEPEAELIESSTPELNDAKESTLSDEAPVRAKIISMTVRPTGSFVM